MRNTNRTRLPIMTAALVAISTVANAADCPAVTIEDDHGLTGEFPNQFELVEFESAADCTLVFSENPDIASLNARIQGNGELAAVASRLPSEPLIVAPQSQFGIYGGVLDVLSNATEAGSSDVLSLRHVNLVRFSSDIQQIVPDVAKSWSWNDDYTQLTFELREGHRWSDGEPFNSDDVVFWFNDIVLNSDIYESTPSTWVWDGSPATVEAIDATTVRITTPQPAPGLLSRFAISFIQPFQPKHFLGQFMDRHNADAAALRAEHGFETEADAINFYYGGSDWKDVPSPLLKDPERAAAMPHAVVPTLETYITISDSTTGRRMVANPYFHMVDTAGNQLPYINELNEEYVPEKEVRNLRVVNGEVDYKMQNLFLEDFPLYKGNEGNGDYSVHLTPSLGQTVYYAFNVDDPEFGDVFNDVRFRQAMSYAIDRDEVLDLVYLGQGEPIQATPAEPGTVAFLDDSHTQNAIEFDPAKANALLDEMGLADSDGDGVREFNGTPLSFQMLFANQGGPIKLHELVRGYWADVGVSLTQREVSSDDYRSKGLAGELTITSWKHDKRSAPAIAQNPYRFVPPFGDRWSPGTGYDWANWHQSGGAEGSEPPADVKRLYELTEQFQAVEIGSEASNVLGKEIADIHARNLWQIGVVGNSILPVVTKNTLHNFAPFAVASYDYYWALPFRSYQWFLTE